jgi:hypothetical protein
MNILLPRKRPSELASSVERAVVPARQRSARVVPTRVSLIRLSQERAGEDVLSWLALLSFLLWMFHSHAVRNALQSVARLFGKFVLHN